MEPINGDKLRGHLEVMILSSLERGEAHGLEILRRLEEAGCGLLRLKEGSLYPALYRLEAAGDVKAAWEEDQQGRRGARRRIYQLPSRGKRKLAAGRVEWQSFARVLRQHFGSDSMNAATENPNRDTALKTALDIIVERAVRPVQTTTKRKRKMREELLAHVSAVFDEELASLGDEQAALRRTAERLGPPAELAGQLQASLPRNERIDRFFEGPPGESTFRKAARIAAVTTSPLLLLMALTLTDTASAESTGFMLAYRGLLAAYSFIVVFTFFFFEAGMRKALFLPSGRSTSKAIVCGLTCFAFSFAIIFLNCWQLHRRDLGVLIGLGIWFATFMVVMQLVLAYRAAARQNYQQQWAALAVD